MTQGCYLAIFGQKWDFIYSVGDFRKKKFSF